jgi:hypothetical protein
MDRIKTRNLHIGTTKGNCEDVWDTDISLSFYSLRRPSLVLYTLDKAKRIISESFHFSMAVTLPRGSKSHSHHHLHNHISFSVFLLPDSGVMSVCYNIQLPVEQ